MTTDPSLTAHPAPGVDFRRATRDSRDLVIGGVAAGLARHLGASVTWVRAGFMLAVVFGGVGLWFYAALWVLLPSDARFDVDAPGLEGATRTGRRPGRVRRLADVGPAIALAALGLGLLLTVEAVVGTGVVVWPALLAAVGVGLLWRQADEAQRERWLDRSGPIGPLRAAFGAGTWASFLRLAAGIGLVVAAITLFVLRGGQLSVARDVGLAALLGIVGLGVVIGPWALRLATDLGAERAERIRTQERADVAAHLHDSVLQTLALIQRNADDGPTVARLARAQERELRTWLYSAEPAGGTTVAGALRELAAAVEDHHGVVVDVVSVGDRDVDERLRPLVLATREAVVNAAKHAGTGRVDVYAECAPGETEVFVRDRGAGFDPSAVADDRLGVRHSIVERMERHGGSAVVRSSPGAGTEVHLRMPDEED